MAIQRWDPLRDLMELQDRMKQLFDETLSRSAGMTGPDAVGSTWRPPMDLFEESNRYVLRVDLPGIGAADVQIKIVDGTMVLSGERPADEHVSRDAYLRVERPHGTFSVQLALPPSVQHEGIQATHKNGVLEVSLPKKRDQRAEHSVPIAAG